MKRLQPRLKTIDTTTRRVVVSAETSPHRGADGRSPLYASTAWRKARAGYLARHPLCRYCLAEGKTEPAAVVDHITPHRGDKGLFWDSTNWQPLCKRCHDSTKAKEEHAAGYRGRGG